MPRKTTYHYDRRKFIAASALSTFGFMYAPKSIWGANDRIRVAGIGIGGKGSSDVSGVAGESPPVAQGQEDAPMVVADSPPKDSSPNGHEEGDVAQFRKSLAGLSRQLELDRLTLLHKTLSGNGKNLPTLSQIADDISGNRPLTPDGDCDEYGKRSSARLEGWVSGLSFGTNRRAKKFPK